MKGASLVDLLAAKEVLVVCGSGGTGKTTVAAALGAQAARSIDGRVLVLTVDPARRLATALGVGAVGHDPQRIDPTMLRVADAGDPRGELWVAMLDTKAGWDQLVRRHAGTAAVAESVLGNSLYRNITGRFVHSHDYIAMERLHELHGSGQYDLVVVDTPPSRNALDLLDAPRRMAEFFGGRLLRWLTVPARSRLLNAASQPFYQVADRVLGSRLLRDIADFFALFQTMEQGLVRRAKEVERLLADDRTAFVVVTTLESAPSSEARALTDELRRRRLHVGAIVANRLLPSSVRRAVVTKAARALVAVTSADPTVVSIARALDARPSQVAAVLQQAGERFPGVATVAAREAERLRELAALGAPVAEVPLLDGDVTDLDALFVLGSALVG